MKNMKKTNRKDKKDAEETLTKSSRKELVLVCGSQGSGKEMFCQCFKNSFLQSLPVLPLYQGLVGGLSFAATSDLTDPKHLTYITAAHDRGYRVTLYYLFSGRLLCAARNRFSALTDGTPYHEAEFKKGYESSYRSLVEIYPSTDLVFFIRNQKGFEFLRAFDPQDTDEATFKEAVHRVKVAVDTLR